jgi:hypothetical protein
MRGFSALNRDRLLKKNCQFQFFVLYQFSSYTRWHVNQTAGCVGKIWTKGKDQFPYNFSICPQARIWYSNSGLTERFFLRNSNT